MRLNLSCLLVFIISFSINAQNIGINEPAPIGKLHIRVNSTTNLPHLRLTEDENDYARIKMENNVYSGVYWDIAGRTNSDPSLSLLNFYFNNGTSGSDKMTVLGNGNVGIGTTSPNSKLDIRSVGNNAEILRLSSERPWVFKQTGTASSANLTLQSINNGKNLELLGADGTTKAAIFSMWNDDPKVIFVPDNGNVGIGESNPGNKVRIKGNSTSTQNVLSVSTTYLGNSNIRAVEGFARPADGYGFGGLFEGGARGVKATAWGGSSSNLAIGVEGSSHGTNGDRIGVFGRASGGSKNWAGYFAEGNMYVTNDLRIGAGAINGATGYKVAIDGKVIAEEMRVQLSGAWPDYVFEDDYKLMPLTELEKEIEKLGHLPGLPSAREAEEEGIMLGDMNRILLEKIEELTLHVIRLEKEIRVLKSKKN
ncbi:MAG: hypothetical protein HKN68_18305 [Saprospiraceae bacterium]|nr:hypothetical protein [Saprospiraceae bacterium]